MQRRKFLSYLIPFLLLVIASVYVLAQKGSNKHSKNYDEIVNEKVQAFPQNTDNIQSGIPTDDDPWIEIGRLSKEYDAGSGKKYKGRINVIDDNSDKENVMERYSFSYEYFKGYYYYQLGNYEIVNNKGLFLLVDHAEKAVTVAKAPISKANQLFDLGKFRELLKNRQATVTVSLSDNQKILTVTDLKDPQVQGYMVYYNPASYTINRILIATARLAPIDDESIAEFDNSTAGLNPFDNDGDDQLGVNIYTYYVEILFDEVKPIDETLKNFHPEQQFIEIVDNNIKLISAYESYELKQY